MASPLFLFGSATVALPHVTSISSTNTYYGQDVWTLSVFVAGSDVAIQWTGSEAEVAAMRDTLTAALDAWWSR